MFKQINMNTLPQKKGKVNSLYAFFFPKAKFSLLVLGVFILLIASGANSFACKVCWSDGSCSYQSGSCNDVCPGSNGYPTCSNVANAMFKQTDYILSKNGFAWVVTGEEKIAVGSDKLEKFMEAILFHFPKGKRESDTAKIKIQAEYDNFFKKNPKDGKVSDSRLQTLSKEIGLKILDEEPKSTDEKAITLVKPGNGDEINLDLKEPINFVWTSTGIKGPYTLKIVAIEGDQSPEEAMKNNKAVYEKEGITTTSAQVPFIAIDEPGIKKNQKFAWQITSGDVKSPYAAIVTSRSNIKHQWGKAAPIPGIRIIVKKDPGGISVRQQTGTDGKFSVELEEGKYDLQISYDRIIDAISRIEKNKGKEKEDYEITLMLDGEGLTVNDNKAPANIKINKETKSISISLPKGGGAIKGKLEYGISQPGIK